jgi:hypothetical protein
MHCKMALTDAFLSDNLSKTFITKEYRAYRASILTERELARMSETMGMAAAEQTARNHEKEIIIIDTQIDELVLLMQGLRAQARRHGVAAYRARHPNEEEAAASARRFTMPCPRENCRGFLSTQYKCGVCEHFVCPDCFEEKEHDREREHTCNPDNVATVIAIRNESKPCPSCGARISKISGCDQMWCVGCHVAFSWRTGQIQNGVVHNPHFFEYQRANGGNGVDANRAHGQCNAERMPQWNIFRGNVTLPLSNHPAFELIIITLRSIYQVGMHIEQIEIPYANNIITELEDNSRLRIKYILGEINKDELKSILSNSDRKRKRVLESLLITQLIYTVLKDMLWAITDTPTLVQVTDDIYTAPLVDQAIVRFSELVAYANEQWLAVSKTYGVVTPHIKTIPYHAGIVCVTYAFNKQKYNQHRASDNVSDE